MNEDDTAWTLVEGEGPLVAVALHHGHAVREEGRNLYALGEQERLREEDPLTGEWTTVAPTRVVVHRSRFEVDLNRPRNQAVYLRPEDAWGLHVWRKSPSRGVVEDSLELYDAFYTELDRLLQRKVERHGRFVLYDLHSYNHRRGGEDAPPAPAIENPEVNVGTGTLDRTFWSPVVDAFVSDLSRFDFLGRSLDVRENVKFKGGNFSRWVNERFPRRGCALAIEFKKFFMDEWTGQPFPEPLRAIRQALQASTASVLEALRAINEAPSEKGPGGARPDTGAHLTSR